MMKSKNSQYRTIIFGLLLVCLFVIQSSHASEWTMYRGGQQQLGIAETILPNELQLRWTFETEGAIKSSAVIAQGKAFIGSSDNNIYAIDLKTGKKAWSYLTEGPVEAPPMFLEGKILCGSTDGYIYCLKASDGTFQWKFETQNKVTGSTNWVMSSDGEEKRIIAVSYDGHAYCIDFQSGKEIWSYRTDNYVNGSPAVHNDHIIFGGCDAFVYLLSAKSGKEIAAYDTGTYIAASAAYDDGNAYVGNYGDEFLSIDVNNEKLNWKYSDRKFPFFSSAAVTNNYVVVGSRDRGIHCIDRKTGDPKWVVRTRGKVDSSPVVCGEDIIVGSEDGRLYRLRLRDGEILWTFEIGESIVSSPAVADGMVVIGADDGNVYLFDDGQ